MTIAEWCIKYNRISTLIFVIIAFGGLFTFVNLGRQEYPEIPVKAAVITTNFSGASPIKVEELVTDKIEDKLSEISEIEIINSKSLAGLSVVTVTLYDNITDVKPIWDKMRNKIRDVRAQLPDGAGEPFVNDEFGDDFPIVIALTADGFNFRELKDVADDLRDEMLALDAVAKVEIHGVQEERIFIEFSNSKLAKFGFSPSELASVLKSENIVKPSGDLEFHDERIIFEASGNYETIEKLKKTSLRAENSYQAVYLEDLADIRRGFVDPPSPLARYNRKRALMIGANMVSGKNILEMGAQIEELVERFKADIPLGINFDTAIYQPKYVQKNLNDFVINLLEAFFFVLVVVLVFVGVRMGLIVGALIPMVTCVCMISLVIFKQDLQMISVAALIIALGMLVDNAVVVSEDVIVKLNQGMDRFEAIKRSMKELTVPLLAASLTTIFAFLPIPLADSSTGQFCYSLFVVICVALVASWLLSISFIPMLCYYFLKPKDEKEDFDTPIYNRYKSLLELAMKYSKIFLIAVFSLLIISGWGFQFVDKNFFPPNEREMFSIDFWQPYGVDITTTEKRLDELERFILDDPEAVSTMSFVGSGGIRWYKSLSPESANSSYALSVVTTHSYKGALELQKKVRDYIDNKMPEVRASVKSLQNGPPVSTPIEIRISGKDIDKLYEIKDQFISYLNEETGVVNIRDDWGEWTKKIYVDINQDKAKRAGLTSEDVALSLQTQFTGLQATQFREGDKVIPILLRSKDYYRKDATRVESMNIYSKTSSNVVPLSQVADIKLKWQASNVRGYNRMRTIILKADLEAGAFAQNILKNVTPKIDAYIASDKWPVGYKVEYGGEKEKSSKAQASIFVNLPLAFALLLLVLMYQFNSVRKVAIIFLTIPPMLIGITPGLYFTKAAFGFFALLGFISLMGILVNNAIMMIDRIDIERAEGKAVHEAVVSAALQRARPIIMTATTTTIGLIPLSLQGGEMWRPMANTIIFGLLFSTVLTLVMCPVLYTIFFRENSSKVNT